MFSDLSTHGSKMVAVLRPRAVDFGEQLVYNVRNDNCALYAVWVERTSWRVVRVAECDKGRRTYFL